MSVMYDSNVIIDILHGLYEPEDDDVCICGVIKSELLQGAVSEKNYRNLVSMMSQLEYVPMREDAWDVIGRKEYLLRTEGITVPANDLAIYVICAQNKIALRTRDRHFQLIDGQFHEITLLGEEDGPLG